MNRESAINLLNSNLKNKNLVKHSIACEGAMQTLAKHFGENIDIWGFAGLMHDIDIELVSNDLERHAKVGAEILKKEGYPHEIIHAVLAHNKKASLESKMDKALLVTDPATGFIVACVLMHPEKKLAALDLDFMLNRFEEKRFAAGANREQMQQCGTLLGLDLNTFLNMVLEGMRGKAEELGL